MSSTRKHHEKKLRQRVERTIELGSSSKRKRDVRMYLHSLDAKLQAVSTANRRLKPHQRVAESALLDIAKQLDPWSGSAEKVIVHLVPKGMQPPDDLSEFRPFHLFGIEHRSLQQLVRPILEARANLHERQFSAKGGVPKAILEVKKALQEGFVHSAEFDLKTYFPSLDGKGLAEYLPLPTRVTENVVTSRSYPLKVVSLPVWFSEDEEEVALHGCDASQFFVAEVRRGIPQGSSISPLVSEMVLSDVIGMLAKDESCRIVNYADNTLVMAKKPKNWGKLGENLSALLSSHPAGPLLLNPHVSFHANGPIEFLGYMLSKSGSNVEISPSPLNLRYCRRRITSALRSAQREYLPPDRALIMLNKLEEYVSSWTGSFHLWTDAKPFKKEALKKIEAILSVVRINGPLRSRF